MKTCPICKGAYPAEFSHCPKDGAPLRPLTELDQGTIIRGKYEIEGLLGRGGMGSVYKARHLVFNETCALKVVKSSLVEEPGFSKRFRAEAHVMRRLRHPNAVQVLDYDETEDGRPFIVMEYVEGRSLDAILESQGLLEPPRAMQIASQVCAALAAAHELGIIHRDIKPSNIFVSVGQDGSEHAKVLDFGVAKLKDQSACLFGLESTTGTGIVVGTPAYMSPEQAMGLRGDQLDGRSDLYSLGVLLFEMLTGKPPFYGGTPVALMVAHAQSPPPDPRMLRPALPTALTNVVLRSLQKEPARRFPSAQAMMEALREAVPGLAIPVSPVSPGFQPDARPTPGRDAYPLPGSPPAARGAKPARAAVTTATGPAPASSVSLVRKAGTPGWAYLGGAALVVAMLSLGVVLFRSGPEATQAPTQMPAVNQQPAVDNPSAPEMVPPSRGKTSRNPQVRQLVERAREALNRGDWKTALEYLRKAQAIDASDPDLTIALREVKEAELFEQAQAQMKGGQYGAAHSSFNSILQMNPNNAAARDGLNRAVQELRQQEGAAQNAATRKPEEEIKRLMQQGKQALGASRHDDAIRAFEAALALDPNNNEAKRELWNARRAKALAVAKTALVFGYVFDPEGKPLQGASVRLYHVDKRYWNEVQTDAEGAFVFAEVPPGKGYVIEVWMKGVATAIRRDIEVPEGEEKWLIAPFELLRVER
ncbi:MAG: protein kinase domain-containing protein [Candidatus Acidiferrales bacterium]